MKNSNEKFQKAQSQTVREAIHFSNEFFYLFFLFLLLVLVNILFLLVVC
jgi:hypothetical protein